MTDDLIPWAPSTTVWGSSSWFVHVTGTPALTVIVAGMNAKLVIVTLVGSTAGPAGLWVRGPRHSGGLPIGEGVTGGRAALGCRTGSSTRRHAMGRFEGKVAVVTGAGSGIGQATAIRFGAEGAAVACLDIAEDEAQK